MEMFKNTEKTDCTGRFKSYGTIFTTAIRISFEYVNSCSRKLEYILYKCYLGFLPLAFAKAICKYFFIKIVAKNRKGINLV